MPELMRVQGRDVPFERRRLPADQLVLDPRNPRIQYLVGRNPGPVSQKTLEDILWRKNQVKHLATSIEQNKGVREEIIVQKGRDGRYVVREGNCRTVAARRLAKKHPDDDSYATLPAMVFDEQLSEEDLAVILADVHVANKIRWDAYEQAKQLSELYNLHAKSYDWLAAHLRLSKSRITQDLRAYEWTSAYLEKNPNPKNLEKFAFFQELARKKDLAVRYADDGQFRTKFDSWLTKKRLTASHQVRKLSQILEHDEATRALDQSGYEAAHTVLVAQDPSVGSDLYDAVKRTTQKLLKTPADEIKAISGNQRKLALLRELRDAIDNLTKLADVAI